MKHTTLLCVVMLLCVGFGFAQQPTLTVFSNSAMSTVPALINFSGTLVDANGKPLSGTAGVTFSLYKDQLGGAALWMETQNVVADKNGHYKVALGSASASGLPAAVFTSGEARWLGVQLEGQSEQARVLLVSVPYALKAADAETLGGKPAAAFLQAVESNQNQAETVPMVKQPTVHGSGTTNFLPIWTAKTTIGNSNIAQSGNNVGIGTTSAKSLLDVSGTGDFRDTLTLFPKGSDAALSVSGTAFSVTSSGLVNFVSGQTFPGAGTITAVNTPNGSGLAGGGNSGSLTLGLVKTCTANQILQWNGSSWVCSSAGTGTITGVTAGTDLTGGGTGGTVTLNVDTTKVAQLSASNTFASQQQFKGNSQVMIVGDAGCGAGFTGIGFGALSGCLNYSLLGDGANTYLNRPKGGTLHVRENNGEEMTIVAGGSVGIGTSIPAGQLEVVSQSLQPAVLAFGASAPAGSAKSGTPGVSGTGGNGDPSSAGLVGGGDGLDGFGGIGSAFDIGNGGSGVFGQGGAAGPQGGTDGIGGNFAGANTSGNVYGDGIDAFAGSGLAGYFQGDIQVTGAISAGTKDFKIDHPLDPANKYLVHASVESSEMTNIYTGNVTTDSQGFATVPLPEWFEALNTDFRYQLTVLAQFAQAIVAREIQNHEFVIRTNIPHVKVSWQITGVRQDAYAKAHPLAVEEEKDARLRGFYVHPDLYGAPQEKQIEWARHPQVMQRLRQSAQGRDRATN